MNVIIGNKGAGKTALADIIGLCGNSDKTSDFVFLNKFKNTSFARKTFAKLIYRDNVETSQKSLADSVQEKTESVKYLPQSYFENITNEVEKVEKFRLEIENVIFQYLSDVEKMGHKSFKEYRKSLSVIEKSKIEGIQKEISILNSKIISLENRSDSRRVDKLKADLEEKKKSLQEHLKKKPIKAEVQKDSQVVESELEKFEYRLKRLEDFKKDILEELTKIAIKRQKINEFNFELTEKINELKKYISLNMDFLEDVDINPQKLFLYNFNENMLIDKEKGFEIKINRYNQYLDKESQGTEYRGNSLKGKISYCQEKISKILSKESKAVRESKRLENEYNKWELKKEQLTGTVEEPNEDTINYLTREIDYIEKELDRDLAVLENKRKTLSIKIMSEKLTILNKIKVTTNSLQDTLNENRENSIKVINDFFFNLDFSKKFLFEINQRVVSCYKGAVDGQEYLKQLIDNYLSEDSNFSQIDVLLDKLVESLKFVDKGKGKQKTDLSTLVNDRQVLYDYIFGLEYVNNEFDLRLGEKKLEQLSPGERGAVLLIFYLLLDKDISPLLIDQPEDNLDNQSVANILVPYIKRAKKRRQIIMVTHNPNLAVVSDAELVINVSIDKENKNRFSYISGGIESKEINKKIQDILEGTPSAFRIRDSKYHIY
ncbi:hypothetical protein RsY01_501 [Lactococcus reticulitermitis]|uniref:ATPase AAA-type core domain-containing protein n=1 Tax=Pseudolactococcus reticulitermitis TaxID=2025039 RepID=A0A224XB97_9LACT|nr:hypothetical protein [Lactococcus reticulitermitis]GAX46921.1 hypothetical protein RsY01_501 [Lactococcus reticulitermitis]